MATKEPLYISFHIGRGGRFHNQGHYTFMAEENFQDLLCRCADVISVIDDDEAGNPLPDKEWQVHDMAGNLLLEGREEIEAMTGRLEFDGDYNTDYVTIADENLRKQEEEALLEAYKDDFKYGLMSEELKKFILEMEGLHGVSNKNNIEITDEKIVIRCLDDYTVTIELEDIAGKMVEEEWEEMLKEKSLCPHSIPMVLDAIQEHDSESDKEIFYNKYGK